MRLMLDMGAHGHKTGSADVLIERVLGYPVLSSEGIRLDLTVPSFLKKNAKASPS